MRSYAVASAWPVESRPPCFAQTVGTDHDLPIGLKRTELTSFDRVVVGSRLQDLTRQEELVGQLLVPLLTEFEGVRQASAVCARPTSAPAPNPPDGLSPGPTSFGQQYAARQGDRKANSAASI